MTDTALIIRCGPQDVDLISAELRAADVEVQASPLRHLDGQQIQEWIVLAGIVGQAAPRILDALTRFLTRNNLRSIKLGDVKIENPRPEDIPALLAAIHRSPDQSP